MSDYPKSVKLRDGRSVVVRPLGTEDFDKLYAFFQALPEEDRMFLRHDLRDRDLVRKWCDECDFGRVAALVAEDGDRIVADGTLHTTSHGWSKHTGSIRLVTARTHRHSGLGTFVARELVSLAEQRHLEKLQVHVIEDDKGAVGMFETIGFEKAAVLEDMVKDLTGKNRNLAIMVNDVPDLGRIMEEWIQESMSPTYRVPGDGAY